MMQPHDYSRIKVAIIGFELSYLQDKNLIICCGTVGVVYEVKICIDGPH